MRVFSLIILGVFTMAGAGCSASTEGTGQGIGKESGGCFQNTFCDPGLECVLGVCVPGDDAGDDAVGDEGDEGPAGPNCGDGVLDLDEECDGAALVGQSCSSLGGEGGTLSCAANCFFDTSACTNPAQPGSGLYSSCLDNDACPGLDGCATVVEQQGGPPLAGFCSLFCTVDADCYADVSGTAQPECNDAATPFCHLDCSGGRTCPGGMSCYELSSGAFSCY